MKPLRPQPGPLDCNRMTASENTDSPRDARTWQGGVYPLGQEPPDDLKSSTTCEERLELLNRLTEWAWALTGRSFPSYERHEIPGKVIRPS